MKKTPRNRYNTKMSMTFEEFISYYKNNKRLPNDVSRRKNPMNEKQLKSRYEKYLKSEEKKRQAFERYHAKDEKWEELKIAIDLRSCQLCERLIDLNISHEIENIHTKAGPLMHIIDPAHVFGKGAYPHMKYDIDNVVPLNRFSHSMLDQSRNPITGEQITAEEVQKWWIFIVGLVEYWELLSRSKNGSVK